MESTKSKSHILLIMSLNEKSAFRIREILMDNGYDVTHVNNIDEGRVLIQEDSPDLVICENQLMDTNGLKIYNTLYKDLVKRGTPFFLYLPEYNKEDVIIGLEMGVDSFIISPFEEKTLLNKVEHHLEKVKKLKILDSEKFNAVFESTPVAKFIAENSQIIRVNQALREISGISFNAHQLPSIDELFDFSENEDVALNYKKCMNGLKHICLLKSVPLKLKNHLRFDIHLVYSDYFGKGIFMAEVVADGNGNNIKPDSKEVKNADASDQQFGTINSDEINFSNREKEVLEWSAQGLPVKQIATILKISDRTVEKHRANIMAKTKTNSIVEAIYAIQLRTS